MRFRDKRTNEIKDVYSIEKDGWKILVKFNENGKEYTYNSSNIEIIDELQTDVLHRIYCFEQCCYKCKQNTTIYTYIVFLDDVNKDVVFPWDKKRLLQNQNLFAHMQDPSVEYYGLKVIGGDSSLDEMLLKKFSNKIKMQYSKTQKRSYAMSICEHCGAKQGEYFIYHYINEMIKNMQM